MKIILSRKGFDSESGAMPSPIMPDGTLLSLPIPSDDRDSEVFSKLQYQKKSYSEIICELKPKARMGKYCHLDPDVRKEVRQREKGWVPLFGQAGSALTHLKDNNVSHNDLFLFFGWFRKVEKNKEGTYEYEKDAPHLHVLYGYLQIDQCFDIENKSDLSKLPKFMGYHSHAQNHHIGENNRIYMAKQTLKFAKSIPGGGFFNYHPDLVLTKNGEKSRSHWKLPAFFKKVEITYHSKKSWENGYFQSVARGQEFVIEDNKDVEKWAKKIILAGTRNK